MSAVLDEAMRQGSVLQAIMAEIDHPDGIGYFWSGHGLLDFGGNTYNGCGTLGSVTSVVTSTEIEIVENRFRLSGADADIVEGLDDSVKGKLGKVFEAFLDDDFRVIERELVSEAQLDYQVYAIGDDGKATIELVAHGGLYWLKNRSAAKWSPEEARSIYPDETGFDEIHLVEDQQDVWRPA